jgi:hypothetical protein
VERVWKEADVAQFEMAVGLLFLRSEETLNQDNQSPDTPANGKFGIRRSVNLLLATFGN